jgi:hypothetical protein
MLDKLNGQAEEQRHQSQPAVGPALLPTKPKLTAAQAALARAQAARAGQVKSPSTGDVESLGRNVTASQEETQDVDTFIDKVLEDLHALGGLTYVFLAGRRDRLGALTAGRGPGTDMAVRLAYHVMLGGDIEGGHLQWFFGAGDSRDEAVQQKATQTVQGCLERLRRRDEIAFVLAWHVEGSPKACLEAAGYTFEVALGEIGEFLAVELRSDLCV